MRAPSCRPLDTLHLLGKRHTAILLEEIDGQPYAGFNHTVRRLKITPKMLAGRLAELEAAELVVKNGDAYEITPKGKELAALFRSIKFFHLKYGETTPACVEQRCTNCSTFTRDPKKKESLAPPLSENERAR